MRCCSGMRQRQPAGMAIAEVNGAESSLTWAQGRAAARSHGSQGDQSSHSSPSVLPEQQRAKARAIDEQVAGDVLPSFEHERRSRRRLRILPDVDDLALDPLDPERLVACSRRNGPNSVASNW